MRPAPGGSDEDAPPDEPSEATGIEHKGGPWYRVRLSGEVIEESARGKDEARQILNEAQDSDAS